MDKKIKQGRSNETQDQILIIEGDLDNFLIDPDIGINTTYIKPSKLTNFNLRVFDMLIICCPGLFIETRAAREVQKFILRGKPLLTTDWCLNTVIERIAPGFICHNGKFTKREEIDLELKDPDHSLVRGMESGIFRNKWCIQAKSMPFNVLTDQVEILISSKIMKQKFDTDACLVAFAKGRGLIVHSLIHLNILDMTPLVKNILLCSQMRRIPQQTPLPDLPTITGERHQRDPRIPLMVEFKLETPSNPQKQCLFCEGDFGSRERAYQCSFCGALYHKTELELYLRTKNTCYKCKKVIVLPTE